MEDGFVIALTPIIEALVPIVMAAVVAGLGVGIRYLMKAAGLKDLEKDAQVRGYLNQAITAAANYGINKTMAYASSQGWDNVRTRNEAIAEATRYLNKAVPDAINHFGLTEEAVKDFFEARIRGEAPKPAPTPEA